MTDPRESHMEEAIRLAQKAVAEGGAPFGTLIVDADTNEVVCLGRNHAAKDCIWHGEMDAISELSKVAAANPAPNGRDDVYFYCANRNLELYTTAEPCPMCMGAILWAGIRGVTYGTSIQKLSNYGWKQINVPCEELAKNWNDKAAADRFRLTKDFMCTKCDKLYESVPEVYQK